MDIYIPNIKLPKDEPGAFRVIVMYVGADGKLRAECEGTHEVTAVPPHGDLIDRKAAYNSILDGMVMTGYQLRALDCISESSVPAIIPADPAEEGE